MVTTFARHSLWTLTVDESTYQIPSNGLLFSTFYHFPYTADPPTSTTPTWPFPTIVRSPLTIPYTHRTIGPVPHQGPPIWPTDHIVTFSFLSLFSFTQCIPLWPDQSQVIAPRDRDLTICFATPEPCARFTYHLYLKTFVSTPKKKEVFPQNSDLSSFRLIISLCSVFTPLHLCSLLYFWHSSPYRTVLNPCLTPLCTPWYYIRRPFHCSWIAPFRTT